MLDRDAPDGIRSGTIWCWTNARWISFFYSAVGDSDSVRRFLGPDLARTVQCDGTSITTFFELRAASARLLEPRPARLRRCSARRRYPGASRRCA